VPLAAYRAAARAEAVARPGCHLPWWLVAGIGFVESGHAHSGGSTHVGWNGVARPPIYGPALDGRHGYKAIPDTDNGVLDGDRRWDRAVGPMQFLPSTWRTWGPPGHLDGHANPQSIVAAAHATAGYLCASGSDVSQPHAMALAVYSYNHSFGYVRLVLSVGARYAGMSPDQLGVNLLPKDHPAKRHHKRHGQRHHRGRNASAHGTTRATTTTSPSPSPSPTPSASPSPSQSSAPIPNPLPTLTPPLIHH
jgi:membrane-bound lytic murein transglycosylase B